MINSVQITHYSITTYVLRGYHYQQSFVQQTFSAT